MNFKLIYAIKRGRLKSKKIMQITKVLKYRSNVSGQWDLTLLRNTYKNTKLYKPFKYNMFCL